MSKDDDYATIISIMNRRGFTIVELLIVIVVIAILAAITIVAYNGIQTRAENTKTVVAVSQWVKALRMYEADQGSWPTSNSCLGNSTTYTASYSGRCYAPDTSGWIVNSTFITQMQPYIGASLPEPSSVNISGDTVSQYRGALFYRATTTDMQIYTHLLGVTTCPDIGGLGTSISGTNYPNGRRCVYRLAGP